MAPEILNKTLNEQSFESYKAADIYALGLVYWEILRRCQTTAHGEEFIYISQSFNYNLISIENDADVYQLPYEDILPHNPGFEQMYDVVCERQIRPFSSSRWETQPVCNK
jgi:hypothetical protein